MAAGGYARGMATHSTADHVAELDLHPNEASGLLDVADAALLDNFGWDRAFWSVLDETDVRDCIVLIGHRRDAGLDEGWSAQRLKVRRMGDADEASDAEAVARWDGWVYVFGSHHGGKSGPIRRKEQWIARFREDRVAEEIAGDGEGVSLTVLDTGFRLHRLVNDALADCDVDVLPMTKKMRKAFVKPTVKELKRTAARDLVRKHDWTINIEGATFTASGSLLLGLRFPVTAEGFPIVVQLDGCAELFGAASQLPAVEAVWAVDAVGRNGSQAGVRDLCIDGRHLQLVTGDLDSAGKGSVIRKEYKGGRSTVSTHFETRLDGTAGGYVDARRVREFPENPRIEGMAVGPEGLYFYVADEDDFIALRSTPLFTGGDG